MAVVKVEPSVHNAGDNQGLIAQLVKMVNAQATAINALTAKIDADAGDTGGDSDYASTIGTLDTLAYRGGGTPS